MRKILDIFWYQSLKMFEKKLNQLDCMGSQGFFSKFLMGGGLKIFGPRRSPTGTKSDGGGLAKKIWLKPKLPT